MYVHWNFVKTVDDNIVQYTIYGTLTAYGSKTTVVNELVCATKFQEK